MNERRLGERFPHLGDIEAREAFGGFGGRFAQRRVAGDQRGVVAVAPIVLVDPLLHQQIGEDVLLLGKDDTKRRDRSATTLADGDALQFFQRLLRNQQNASGRRTPHEGGTREEKASRAAKILDARHQSRVVAAAFERIDQGGLGFVGEARGVGVTIQEAAQERSVGDEVGGAETERSHGCPRNRFGPCAWTPSRGAPRPRAESKSVLLIAPV
jgi:hypothetical protein